PVNPKMHSQAQAAMTNNFVRFLLSAEVQKLIGEYGVEKYGKPLFTPALP
ncbi:MAG: Tungsten transporter substrate-binding protein, partial [Dehalococcoidia bacterium]|nr:Tungsten transporter substrate-binding protein [Dehalococcoidia bacterium]